MDLYKDYITKEIEFLTVKNKLMKDLRSENGFMNLYSEILKQVPDSEKCFAICNIIYNQLFRKNCYDKFSDFNIRYKNIDTLNILEREFLMAWFKHNGFDTWESFKAIVIYYYSEVTEVKLREFYSNAAIDSDVLLKVGYVKQIIGG